MNPLYAAIADVAMDDSLFEAGGPIKVAGDVGVNKPPDGTSFDNIRVDPRMLASILAGGFALPGVSALGGNRNPRTLLLLALLGGGVGGLADVGLRYNPESGTLEDGTGTGEEEEDAGGPQTLPGRLARLALLGTGIGGVGGAAGVLGARALNSWLRRNAPANNVEQVAAARTVDDAVNKVSDWVRPYVGEINDQQATAIRDYVIRLRAAVQANGGVVGPEFAGMPEDERQKVVERAATAAFGADGDPETKRTGPAALRQLTPDEVETEIGNWIQRQVGNAQQRVSSAESRRSNLVKEIEAEMAGKQRTYDDAASRLMQAQKAVEDLRTGNLDEASAKFVQGQQRLEEVFKELRDAAKTTVTGPASGKGSTIPVFSTVQPLNQLNPRNADYLLPMIDEHIATMRNEAQLRGPLERVMSEVSSQYAKGFQDSPSGFKPPRNLFTLDQQNQLTLSPEATQYRKDFANAVTLAVIIGDRDKAAEARAVVGRIDTALSDATTLQTSIRNQQQKAIRNAKRTRGVIEKLVSEYGVGTGAETEFQRRYYDLLDARNKVEPDVDSARQALREAQSRHDTAKVGPLEGFDDLQRWQEIAGDPTRWGPDVQDLSLRNQALRGLGINYEGGVATQGRQDVPLGSPVLDSLQAGTDAAKQIDFPMENLFRPGTRTPWYKRPVFPSIGRHLRNWARLRLRG